MTRPLRRAVACGLVVALAMCSANASATESPALPAVPFGFSVAATNGWTAKVVGGVNPATGQGAVEIMLRRGGARAIYATTRVTFTEGTVTADFGALGRIEVHSVPTGGTATARPSCGGKPVRFPAGRWEGTISFHGEEGFTNVEASSAPADITFELDLFCGSEVNEGFGGRSPGALLTLKRRHGGESLELTVRKNKRVGPSRFDVNVGENRGDMFIGRSVKIEAGSGAFGFTIPPGRATVRPPKPFSGSLNFQRTSRHASKVTGDLAVNLPGHADFPILGPGKLRASLERAVLNPSHPF